MDRGMAFQLFDTVLGALDYITSFRGRFDWILNQNHDELGTSANQLDYPRQGG